MLWGLAIVASTTTPLFAFATDGSVTWLRESGSRLFAIDTATGESVREVELSPAPFGMTWRVERHGAFFVVRDGMEISAYEDATGRRLWRRASPKHVDRVEGTHVLPPVATASGVHVASVERTAFRPESPAVRMTVQKHPDARLGRRDPPRLDPPRVEPIPVDPRSRSAGADGRHHAMVPAPRDGSEGAAPTSRDGMLGLLALLGASSNVLVRIADAYELRSGVIQRIQRLGVTLRDPRARWSALMGRDPSLVDIGENGDGDAIATYFYPRAPSGRVPVVLVARTTGDAQWLADDLDAWFAGVLEGGLAYAPDAVRTVLRGLGLSDDFPRPLPRAIPPPWFFEAHATPWTLDDADAALAAGDIEGAERMLVSAGRAATGDTPRLSAVKTRLVSVYGSLGWDHHRATVVETW